MSWVVCGHLLGLWSSSGPVVHFLARGLWSCPGWVCGHLLCLWSCPGSWAVVTSWVCLWSSPRSVVISCLLICGHVLGVSLVISWVCGHFLDRGLCSCPGWVCGHLWGLWSFPTSWSVVISGVSGHFWVFGHILGLHVFWNFMSSGFSCLLDFHVFWVIFCACIFMSWVGLWSSSGSVVIIWIVACGHVLEVSVVMSGLWSSSGSVIISWIVGSGHVLVGSVFMSCVYHL